MSRHLTLRVSDAEFDFLNRLAEEKGVTRTAVARHLLLQNLTLHSIKEEIEKVMSLRVSLIEKRLAEMQADAVKKDELVKATNYIIQQVQQVKK